MSDDLGGPPLRRNAGNCKLLRARSACAIENFTSGHSASLTSDNQLLAVPMVAGIRSTPTRWPWRWNPLKVWPHPKHRPCRAWRNRHPFR